MRRILYFICADRRDIESTSSGKQNVHLKNDVTIATKLTESHFNEILFDIERCDKDRHYVDEIELRR